MAQGPSYYWRTGEWVNPNTGKKYKSQQEAIASMSGGSATGNETYPDIAGLIRETSKGEEEARKVQTAGYKDILGTIQETQKSSTATINEAIAAIGELATGATDRAKAAINEGLNTDTLEKYYGLSEEQLNEALKLGGETYAKIFESLDEMKAKYGDPNKAIAAIEEPIRRNFEGLLQNFSYLNQQTGGQGSNIKMAQGLTQSFIRELVPFISSERKYAQDVALKLDQLGIGLQQQQLGYESGLRGNLANLYQAKGRDITGVESDKASALANIEMEGVKPLIQAQNLRATAIPETNLSTLALETPVREAITNLQAETKIPTFEKNLQSYLTSYRPSSGTTGKSLSLNQGQPTWQEEEAAKLLRNLTYKDIATKGKAAGISSPLIRQYG